MIRSAYNPTRNGIAKRINETIAATLGHFSNNFIQTAIDLAQRKLRMCHHIWLGCTPYELVHRFYLLNINVHIKLATIEQAYKRSKHNSEINKTKKKLKKIIKTEAYC